MSGTARSSLQRSMAFTVRCFQGASKHAVVLCLSLLLSIALLEIAQGLFQVVHAFGFVKKPQPHPVDLSSLSGGMKLLALYLTIIFLLSRYRSKQVHRNLIERVTRYGIALGVVMLLIVGFTQVVAQYGGNHIDCELPNPRSAHQDSSRLMNLRQ